MMEVDPEVEPHALVSLLRDIQELDISKVQERIDGYKSIVSSGMHVYVHFYVRSVL